MVQKKKENFKRFHNFPFYEKYILNFNFWGARKDDTRWPYIAKARLGEDGSDAYFKITLKFIRYHKISSLIICFIHFV